jgi:hypothetical protein
MIEENKTTLEELVLFIGTATPNPPNIWVPQLDPRTRKGSFCLSPKFENIPTNHLGKTGCVVINLPSLLP